MYFQTGLLPLSIGSIMTGSPAYATGCSAVVSTPPTTSTPSNRATTSNRHFQHYVHPRQEVLLRSDQKRYPTVNIFNHNNHNNRNNINNMMRRDTHSCDDLVRYFAQGNLYTEECALPLVQLSINFKLSC